MDAKTTDPQARISPDETPVDARAETDIADTGSGAAKEPKRTPIWRRPVFLIFLAFVLLAMAAGGFYYWFYIAPFQTTDDAYIDADIVQITPQVSGQIDKVAVGNNVHVKRGDLLVSINPAAATAALQSARSQLQQARAQLTEAKAGVEQARQQAAQARAEEQGAEIAADTAKDNFERNQRLAKANTASISEKALDDSRAASRQAEANAAAAGQAVNTAQANIGVAEAKVQAAEASVQTAQANVDAARIDLAHTRITAQQAGEIVKNDVGVGTFATVGQPLMSLVPDRVFVTANFKETQLADIRVGQSVDIAVDAYPSGHFEGKVVSIQKGAGRAFSLLPSENATGNYVKVVQRVPVRISINNPDPKQYLLGPGMSVVPSIRVK